MHGLIHAEYQGWEDRPATASGPGESSPDKAKCWYNALTLATSTNGARASPTPRRPPTTWAARLTGTSRGIGPIGVFQPSNIVRGKDGLFYVLVHVEGYGVQPTGACLWRTA